MITHDLRDGLRSLRQQPGFALAAGLAFALAIGTNTAIFAALYAVVFTPLPFDEPSRLVMVWRQAPTRALPVLEVSHRHFRDWQAQTRSFDGLAAISSVNWSFDWTLPNGERRRIRTAAVSHEFFPLLGATPLLGRTFLPDDDRTNAGGVVVISENFWTRELARDPAVVGRTLALDHRPFTIVGVMPRAVAFPYGAEMWSPVSPMIGPKMIDAPWWGVLYVVGRLRPGVEPAQARQELDPLVVRLERDANQPGADAVASVVTPLTDYVFGNTRPILLALGGTGVVVLTIACANVIGLLLVRALARRRDSAIRAALGASRWQMIRLWLVESLLLAGGGLAGGLVLAWWGARALVRLAPASTPQLDGIALHLPVIAFAAGVCLLSAIVCGIVPAWVASRLDLRDALNDGARAGESRSRRRARHALVVAQLALSMMLLVAAGLMIRSVLALRDLDLGYVPERVLTMDFTPAARERAATAAVGGKASVDVGTGQRADRGAASGTAAGAAGGGGTVGGGAASGAAGDASSGVAGGATDAGGEVSEAAVTLHYRAAYEELLTRIRALPQVQAAAATYQLPLIHGPIGMDAGLRLEGQVAPSDWTKNPTVNMLSVTADYFESMGTRLLRGRTFTSRDTAAAPLAVIVSESMARRLWPGREALGQRLRLPGAPLDAQKRPLWLTVVGVVQDARFRGIDTVRLDAYVPHQQNPERVQTVVVRTSTADPLRIAGEVRAIARAVDPGAIVGRVQTMEGIVATAMAPWRFGMLLFAVLAAVAFALALTGLFGVISYSVAQRRREMAVRLALGALPAQVRGLIVRQGAALIGAGVAVGLACAAVVSRALASVLFEVSPADPLTFAVVLLLVSAVGLAACYLAARRTTRITALTLLR